MKNLPSIPATDLARIAPLTEDQQHAQLHQHNKGWPPFTYQPTRGMLPGLMNIQIGSMFKQPDLTLKQVEDGLRRTCKDDSELKYNLMAARALHGFAKKHGIFGRRDDEGGFGQMPLGQGHNLVLWENGVVLWEERPHVLFVDLRSTKYLTKQARRFAFSAQHEQIRMRDPNMEGAGLLILRVQKPEDGVRTVIPYTDAGIELYSFDELDQMTRRTYEIWAEVYYGRVEKERQRAAGDGLGPLFE